MPEKAWDKLRIVKPLRATILGAGAMSAVWTDLVSCVADAAAFGREMSVKTGLVMSCDTTPRPSAKFRANIDANLCAKNLHPASIVLSVIAAAQVFTNLESSVDDLVARNHSFAHSEASGRKNRKD